MFLKVRAYNLDGREAVKVILGEILEEKRKELEAKETKEKRVDLKKEDSKEEIERDTFEMESEIKKRKREDDEIIEDVKGLKNKRVIKIDPDAKDLNKVKEKEEENDQLLLVSSSSSSSSPSPSSSIQTHKKKKDKKEKLLSFPCSRLPSHFIMNLPAMAPEFMGLVL
jgi:hypothetical protein